MLAVLGVLLLGGCENLRGLYRVDTILYGSEDEQKKAEGEFVKDGEKQEKKGKDHYEPINLDSYDFRGESDGISAYQQAVTDPVARDRLQTIIMQLSDRVCEKHLGDINANASFVNLGFGGLSALFSGTGAVVGGEVAKSALSAAASIMVTGRALVNEEVYQKRLASGIVKAIREDRDNKDQEI
jgi:hypothetical protein